MDLIAVFLVIYVIGCAAWTYLFGAACASKPQSEVEKQAGWMILCTVVWPVTTVAALLMLIFQSARSGGGSL